MEIDEQKKSDDEIFNTVVENKIEENKRFQKFTVRDICFLAICAAAGLLFSAVMPLVAHVPVYGIIQIVVSVQTSLFLSLGLFKVRKHGSLLIIALLYSILQVFMAPVMFFMSLISALIIEGVFLIFKNGYHITIVRYLATILFIPLQMPMLWIYYSAISHELPDSYVGNSWWFILLMVLAVIALNVLGTVLGNVIGKELEKAGVLDGKKKKENKNK